MSTCCTDKTGRPVLTIVNKCTIATTLQMNTKNAIINKKGKNIKLEERRSTIEKDSIQSRRISDNIRKDITSNFDFLSQVRYYEFFAIQGKRIDVIV